MMLSFFFGGGSYFVLFAGRTYRSARHGPLQCRGRGEVEGRPAAEHGAGDVGAAAQPLLLGPAPGLQKRHPPFEHCKDGRWSCTRTPIPEGGIGDTTATPSAGWRPLTCTEVAQHDLPALPGGCPALGPVPSLMGRERGFGMFRRGSVQPGVSHPWTAFQWNLGFWCP